MSEQWPANGGHGIKAPHDESNTANWTMPVQHGLRCHCVAGDNATCARAIDATSATKAAGGRRPGQCKSERHQRESWRLRVVGHSAFATRAMTCDPTPAWRGRQRHYNEGNDASARGQQRHCNTGHGTIAMCNGNDAIATRATTPA